MGLRFRLARFLENKAAMSASGIIAISEATKKDIIEILGYPAEKIAVTHLGVDPSFFVDTSTSLNQDSLREKYDLPNTGNLLLYVGGIDPRKNVSFLFSVLRELQKNSEHEVHLAIAGNISKDKFFPNLKKSLSAHKLEDRAALSRVCT